VRNIVATTVATGLLFQSVAMAGTGVKAVAAAVAPVAPVIAVIRPPVLLTGYTVTVLPLDTAGGMNDGIIVGTAQGNPVAYVNGQVEPLPGFDNYTAITPTSVSATGYIVGYATSTTPSNVPYRRGLFWASRSNAPIDMGALGQFTMPLSINSSGVAVGVSYQTIANGGPVGAPTAFAWSISGGLRSIAPPLSNQSYANSISDSGYVAGYAWYGGQQAATRWYPGSFQAGTTEFGNIALWAREDGTVYSYAKSWDLSNKATLIAPTPSAYVYGISSIGRRIGIDNPNMQLRAWTVPAGGTTEQILPVPSGITSSFVTQVDGCGSILGWVRYPDNSTKAVLWTKLTCDQSAVLAQ